MVGTLLASELLTNTALHAMPGSGQTARAGCPAIHLSWSPYVSMITTHMHKYAIHWHHTTPSSTRTCAGVCRTAAATAAGS